MPITPAHAAVSLHTQIDRAATKLLYITNECSTFRDMKRGLRELDDFVIELVELRDQHFREVDRALLGKGLLFKNAFDAVNRADLMASGACRKDIAELCSEANSNLLKPFDLPLDAQM